MGVTAVAAVPELRDMLVALDGCLVGAVTVGDSDSEGQRGECRFWKDVEESERVALEAGVGRDPENGRLDLREAGAGQCAIAAEFMAFG